MLSEFINQNLIWVIAFAISCILLIVSLFTGQVKGVKQLSVLHFPQIQRDGKSILIDTRDASEFKKGHISGAISIAEKDINTENKKIMKYKNQPIVLICQTGQQHSIAAAKWLLSNDFNDVYILTGGMNNWSKENLPVVSN